MTQKENKTDHFCLPQHVEILQPPLLSGVFFDQQTVAEAVNASHDLRLPAEHMPLEVDLPKRKKKRRGERQDFVVAKNVG